MIILASQSPRRKELMKDICPSFSIVVSDIDESASLYMPPIEAVRDIAKRKGESIAVNHFEDVVISADTIVVLNDEIIGKPKGKKDAKKILNKLSNHGHQVITAYAIFYKELAIVNHVITNVIFESLSDESIDRYIETGSPMDKAGAYGIQDKDFKLVKKIIGSYTNVLGFPVDEIKRDLSNYSLLDIK